MRTPLFPPAGALALALVGCEWLIGAEFDGARLRNTPTEGELAGHAGGSGGSETGEAGNPSGGAGTVIDGGMGGRAIEAGGEGGRSGSPVSDGGDSGTCGEERRYPIDRLVEAPGVLRDFIEAHEAPVVTLATETPCSGTLIQGGLLLTASHCIDANDVGTVVQVHVGASATPSETYPIAQVLEVNEPYGYALARVAFSPDLVWGANALEPETEPPAAGDALIAIGFSAEGADRVKSVGVGSVESSTPIEVWVSGIAGVSGASGEGLLSPTTGAIRAIGADYPMDGCPDQPLRAVPVSAVFVGSRFIKDPTGSLRHYAFAEDGLTERRWRDPDIGGHYDQLVPGHFTPASTQQLLLYNRRDGEVTFRTVFDDEARAHEPIGVPHPTHTDWSQILALQLDATPTDELVFYSARRGVVQVMRTDGAGALTSVRTTPGYEGWSLLSGGDFDEREGVELLAYRRATGELLLFGTNADGTLEPLRSAETTLALSILVAGEFDQNYPKQEILTYDPIADLVTLFAFDAGGSLVQTSQISLGTHVTNVVVGDFFSEPGNELMFYDPSSVDVYPDHDSAGTSGLHLFYRVSESVLTPLLVKSQRSSQYSRVVTGEFVAPGVHTALLYSPFHE